MPSLVAPRALKAATNEPSWRRRITMSGPTRQGSSRTWEISSLSSLAPAFAMHKRAPPRSRGGDLLQVLRPEQPILSVRKAYVDGYVLFSPVAAHDLTDHAPLLRDPMVLTHPYLHSDARFFCSYVLEACQQPDQGRASSSASVAESCMPSVVWV